MGKQSGIYGLVLLGGRLDHFQSGNRVRIYFEYHEYKFAISSSAGDSDVIGAGISKASQSKGFQTVKLSSQHSLSMI